MAHSSETAKALLAQAVESAEQENLLSDPRRFDSAGPPIHRTDRFLVKVRQIAVRNADGTLMPQDPAGGDAALDFLEAGKIFRIKKNLAAALDAFKSGRSCAGELQGDEWRKLEIDCLGRIAEVWLTLSEVAASGSPLKRESNVRAADAAMQASWLSADLGLTEGAYAHALSAAHRYHLGDELPTAADVYANDVCELAARLGKSDMAADYLDLAADLLQRSQPAPRNKGHLCAEWYRKAGMLRKGAQDDNSRAKALTDFARAAECELAQPRPSYALVKSDYREAADLAKITNDADQVDALTYLSLSAARRDAFQSRKFVTGALSALSDWIWGYGLRLGPLLRTVLLTILLFAGAYALRGEVQLGAAELDPNRQPLAYAVQSIEFSAYALLPVEIVKKLTGFGLVGGFTVRGWSAPLSLVEGLLGLGYFSMAGLYLKRRMRKFAAPPA